MERYTPSTAPPQHNTEAGTGTQVWWGWHAMRAAHHEERKVQKTWKEAQDNKRKTQGEWLQS